MAKIHQAAVSIGNSATADLFGQTVSDTLAVGDTPKHYIIVQNDGSTDVYLGNGTSGFGLDTSTGQILSPGESFRLCLEGQTRLSARAGSSGGNVRVLIGLE